MKLKGNLYDSLIQQIDKLDLSTIDEELVENF